MKFVHYHQDGREPMRFAVLKEHEDGKVDIGSEAGELVVSGADVLDSAKPGCCTAVEAEAKQLEPSGSEKSSPKKKPKNAE